MPLLLTTSKRGTCASPFSSSLAQDWEKWDIPPPTPAKAMDMMEKGQGRVVKLYGIVGDCKSLAFTLLEERFDSFIILHITTFALKGLLLYPLTTPFT